MKTPFELFLTCDSLGTLQEKYRSIGDLRGEEKNTIRKIIDDWQDINKLSNILFYPLLIPDDIRVSVTLKGLAEKKHKYVAIATTVGMQEYSGDELSDESRISIAESLIKIINTNEDLLADRASALLIDFLHKEDINGSDLPFGHPSEVVRHNVIGWAYENLVECDIEALLELVGNQAISEFIYNRIHSELKKYEAQKSNGMPVLLGGPIYKSVPDFKDFKSSI